ncbi:MAG: VOC family protein [Chloroflexota bacterium]
MNCRKDHVTLNCKSLEEAARFYETHFGGKATAMRQGGDGRKFCFVDIGGAAAIQPIESPSESGINHYGFVADDMDQMVTELRAKKADIIREIRDANGKVTTLFVDDNNGLKMEIRLPRRRGRVT